MRAFIAILALSLTSAVAVASEPAASASKYDKPGYVTAIEKGRLWVFREGSKELDAFRQHGEPTVSVAKIGSGPEGMTIKGPSMEVIDAYLASQ